MWKRRTVVSRCAWWFLLVAALATVVYRTTGFEDGTGWNGDPGPQFRPASCVVYSTAWRRVETWLAVFPFHWRWHQVAVACVRGSENTRCTDSLPAFLFDGYNSGNREAGELFSALPDPSLPWAVVIGSPTSCLLDEATHRVALVSHASSAWGWWPVVAIAAIEFSLVIVALLACTACVAAVTADEPSPDDRCSDARGVASRPECSAGSSPEEEAEPGRDSGSDLPEVTLASLMHESGSEDDYRDPPGGTVATTTTVVVLPADPSVGWPVMYRPQTAASVAVRRPLDPFYRITNLHG